MFLFSICQSSFALLLRLRSLFILFFSLIPFRVFIYQSLLIFLSYIFFVFLIHFVSASLRPTLLPFSVKHFFQHSFFCFHLSPRIAVYSLFPPQHPFTISFSLITSSLQQFPFFLFLHCSSFTFPHVCSLSSPCSLSFCFPLHNHHKLRQYIYSDTK